MYERLSPGVRKVIGLARQEARRFNHEYIGTEHVLLGVLREGSDTVANLLGKLKIDHRKIYCEVEKVLQPAPEGVRPSSIPQTPAVRNVLEYAREEAWNLKHDEVEAGHLLLGLLREQGAVAYQILTNLGLKIEDVRFEVLNQLGRRPDAGKSGQGGILSGGLPQESAPHVVRGDPAQRAWIAERQRELHELIERFLIAKQEAVASQKFEQAAALYQSVNWLRNIKAMLGGQMFDG